MNSRLTYFEHLVSTTAKEDSCHKCHAPTWTLWVEGILTTLDVDPLDLIGEIQARLSGIRTYQIRRHDQGFRASIRHHLNIQPDDHNHKTILALHECDPTGMIAQGHPNYYANRYELVTTERPPF
jgi:hypothetical protein